MYSIPYCLTMISESLKTFNSLTFRSMAFFSPCTRASYSTVLFVHSNSSLQDRKCRLPLGLMRMHPAPDPSCDLEPSKYKVQTCGKNLSASSFYVLSSFPPVCSVISNAGSWQKRVSSAVVDNSS
jgi:hypothetical protein